MAPHHWLWPLESAHRMHLRLEGLTELPSHVPPPHSLPEPSTHHCAGSSCWRESFRHQELPCPLELTITEDLSPKGCRSSSLIWPPDGLTAALLPLLLPCVLLSSHTLDRLCWLLPCSTITIFEEPLPAPADPPAKLVLLHCDTGVVSDADHGHRKHWLLTGPCQEPKTRSNTASPRPCNPDHPLTSTLWQHGLAAAKYLPCRGACQRRPLSLASM